jgi:hypothetical protein
MAPVMGDENGEGEAMGCDHFQRVSGLNVRLDRTADWAGQKNMAESMR